MRTLFILIAFVFASVHGAEIRLFDNSSVNAVIDGVDKTGMKVTLMDGEAKTIPAQLCAQARLPGQVASRALTSAGTVIDPTRSTRAPNIWLSPFSAATT